MHRPDRRTSVRPTPRLALLTIALALVLAAAPAVARADGDPASDVLVSQTVFLPWDAGASSAQEVQLAAVARAASARGDPTRVAVIASAKDLGSVTALWRQPQSYAEYLGDELSLLFRGNVLVVMPNGFGLYRDGVAPGVERAALLRAGLSDEKGSLASSAVSAVRALAAASGHALSLSSAHAVSSPGKSSPSARDVTAWIVFLVGAWLVAIAWWASLRARRPSLRGRHAGAPRS